MMRVKNRVVSFVLSLFILFGTVLSVPARPVKAVEPVSTTALVNYILTVIGAVSAGSTVIEKVSGTNPLTALADTITTCLGDGSIYISANGDYVFNSDSTKAIYEALTNDASKNAKVVSSFPDIMSYSGENFDSAYINAQFWEDYNTCKVASGDSFLVVFYQTYDPSTNNRRYNTTAYFYDISDVAYFNAEKIYYDGFWCYNAQNNTFYVPRISCTCNYGVRDNSFSNSINTTPDNSWKYVPIPPYNTLAEAFVAFPVIPYSGAYGIGTYLYYANRSIVISQNATAGRDLANQTTGIIYNNYYDIIPSVNETVLNENNWENIYNSYITTVNNEYQTIYDDNGSVTAEELRAILKSVGDRIDDIISEAGGEIIENLDDILTWLQRIYDRLGLIEEGLSDVAENQADVEEVISSIETIVSGYSTDLARLQQIYVVLGQILNAIPSGGGGGGNINIDIVTDVPDLLDDDVLDLIDKTDVLESALEGVIPFCFIPFAGVIINGLARQPSEAPSFTMPIKLQNGIVDIDVEQEISLEMFDSIHTFYVAGWCILLIISLIFVTFKLFLFINTFI